MRTHSAHYVLKLSGDRQPEECVLVSGVFLNGLIYFATLVRVLKCLNLTGSVFTAAHPVGTRTIRSPSGTAERERNTKGRRELHFSEEGQTLPKSCQQIVELPLLCCKNTCSVSGSSVGLGSPPRQIVTCTSQHLSTQVNQSSLRLLNNPANIVTSLVKVFKKPVCQQSCCTISTLTEQCVSLAYRWLTLPLAYKSEARQTRLGRWRGTGRSSTLFHRF